MTLGDLSYDPVAGRFTWPDGSLAGGLNKMGYWQIGVSRQRLTGHRIAFFKMNGRWPGTVDHINGKRHDNQTDGRSRYLGTFDTAESAHAAYLAVKRAEHSGCTL